MSDTTDRFIAQADKVLNLAQELTDATQTCLNHLNNAIILATIEEIEKEIQPNKNQPSD